MYYFISPTSAVESQRDISCGAFLHRDVFKRLYATARTPTIYAEKIIVSGDYLDIKRYRSVVRYGVTAVLSIFTLVRLFHMDDCDVIRI